MSVTVDANVLVYASNEAASEHEPARRLLENLAAGPDLVYLFWPTVFGYLRLVTHPGVLPRPLAPEEAEENVAGLLARPHVRSPGEVEGFFDLYLATRISPTRGNDVPDAHLVTLMREYGVRIIWTRDRDFRRFDGIEVRDPLGR